MTILPIVGRELRVAARRGGTYWIRTGAAFLVVAVGTWVMLMSRERPPLMGKTLFSLMTGGATLFALFSGLRSTSDCLSREKRDGTLGLLFLTDLKGYDVVLGKLAANSLAGFYGMLAILPVLAIPLLLGGLTGMEFARMALVAVNTMFFSLCVGICLSAFCRNAQISSGLTLLVLLLIAAGMPAIGGVLDSAGRRSLVVPFLLPSPGFAYAMGFDALYHTGPERFWGSLAIVQAIGWLALGVASFVAPHSWQDRPAGGQRRGWRERWRAMGMIKPEQREEFRRRCLNANAFFWLAARVRSRPAQVWLVLCLMGCGWLWGLWKFRWDWLNEGVYFVTAVVLNLLLRGWFASEAGRQLTEERKAGTLELLLSTPLSVREIFRGQWLALERQFLGPGIVVLGLNIVLMAATLSENSLQGDRPLWICLWLGMMAMVVADLVALYWVGLWQGISARNLARVSSATVVPVLVMPWVLMAIVMLIKFQRSMRGAPEPTWQFTFGWWLGIGLATDLVLSLWCRMRLRNEFREFAARRYSAPRSLWRRLFGDDS